jgi:very-short-patch-repair endonuclease
MTKAEACLWKYVLRGGMMKGYTFNRQRPVMNYITDFFCKKLGLVVEVDGITHHVEETYQKDMIRQQELEKAGLKVIRFTDEEVLKNIEGVQTAIEHCVEEREKELQFTSPISPSGRGTIGRGMKKLKPSTLQTETRVVLTTMEK